MTAAARPLRTYPCCGVALEDQSRPGPAPRLCPACVGTAVKSGQRVYPCCGAPARKRGSIPPVCWACTSRVRYRRAAALDAAPARAPEPATLCERGGRILDDVERRVARIEAITGPLLPRGWRSSLEEAER